MNWGYKILAVYIVFVLGIAFMVIRSSSQKMDLVTEDYYGKELKYQEIINESKSAEALSEKLKYEVEGNLLRITFPKDFAGQQLSGEAELYYPADENRDIRSPFNLKDTALVIPLSAANKGLHELHISWQADGVKYYFEKKIFI